MDHRTVQLLGLPMSSLGTKATLDVLTSTFGKWGGYGCFVNVHTMTESLWNSGLRNALGRATWLFADGMPLVWLSRLRGTVIESRVCGPDFVTEMFKRFPTVRYGFLGGSVEQGHDISRKFGLVDSVSYSPPMRAFSPENVREDIHAFLGLCGTNEIPPVVWVGLGAPKQELWMAEATRLLPQVLFLGVGAAFDFLSGSKKRAPAWMQRLGLEWFFRLCSEPKRLWKRYFVTNLVFCFFAAKELVFPLKPFRSR